MTESLILSPPTLDCTGLTTREINQQLKKLAAAGADTVDLLNPQGRHNLAVAIEAPLKVRIRGPVGYYCGGLSEGVDIEVDGPCGWSVGENLMAGRILVKGNASACAAASAHGGTVCILGSAGPRAGISLKGGTLIVQGNVGHSSAFMMQAGTFIICGDAGHSLGDSLYDGTIYVGGEIASLGADAQLAPMTDEDNALLEQQLSPYGLATQDYAFKKIVCAKQLYHFKAQDFSKFKDAY
ncbi:protein glxC [Pseudanabaena sp. FACHB-2040]|uniref:GltB/FmdC/FwdC-like GXGXG domain-containing protein n=1 Tax=Pseudanabaena sp. FACHB-2040 TaxID=2692859 RepID=UPI0016861D1A|nr:protein glxC [Pseudanabaena sp. FACHB-2040]MBD2260383.1 protein glxC [Pseudanabaena sp. FACHB-2040]